MSAPPDTLVSASALRVDRQQMPFETDAGFGWRARLGLIVLGTDQTIEHEFRQMLQVPGVAVFESRLHNDVTINPDTLKAMERDITAATRLIVPNIALDVVAYACTSGSVMIGEQAVHARIHEVRPGIPCSTPMEASRAALKALGARRVALITPYLDSINRRMREYLLRHGFEVPVMGSWNVADDGTVARITPATVCKAVRELALHAEVDAAFVSCTSLRVAENVEELERAIGKPVTSSNHSLAWHCLRLAGIEESVSGFGRLFRMTLNGSPAASAQA